MTEAVYCNECGAKIIRYWHKLNKPLCSAMIKIYCKYKLNSVKISSVLAHNQICNFQKLKYWGFVEEINAVGKGGEWRLTPRAEKFIFGEISVPKRVQTYRSKVVSNEGFCFIKEIVEGYQFKPEYVEEAEWGI
jgi:hypothetical protein